MKDDFRSASSLTHQVRNLLNFIPGQVNFPGNDELRCQVPSVTVGGGRITMLVLRVDVSVPSSITPDGPAPLSAIVTDDSEAAVGELLLWLEKGHLSGLEFAWWTDEPPVKLPSPDRLLVTGR